MALRNELFTAVVGNDIVTARRLITPAEDTAAKEAYGNLLLEAVKKDHIDIARLLLEAGAVTSRKTANGNSCYHIALLRQNQAMLKCLVSYDTSGFHLKNSANETPVDLAIRHDYQESLEILLKQAAAKEYNEPCHDITTDDNNYRRGYLHKAVSYSDAKIIELLLSCGFTLEMTDSLGRTPEAFAQILDQTVGGKQSSQQALSKAITSWSNAKRLEKNTAMNLLALFVQAKRQDKSDQKPHLGRMSNDTMLHVLSFLSDSVQNKQNAIPDMKTFLDRISNECKSKTEQKDKGNKSRVCEILDLLKHGFTSTLSDTKGTKKITLSSDCTKEKPLRKKPGASV